MNCRLWLHDEEWVELQRFSEFEFRNAWNKPGGFGCMAVMKEQGKVRHIRSGVKYTVTPKVYPPWHKNAGEDVTDGWADGIVYQAGQIISYGDVPEHKPAGWSVSCSWRMTGTDAIGLMQKHAFAGTFERKGTVDEVFAAIVEQVNAQADKPIIRLMETKNRVGGWAHIKSGRFDPVSLINDLAWLGHERSGAPQGPSTVIVGLGPDLVPEVALAPSWASLKGVSGRSHHGVSDPTEKDTQRTLKRGDVLMMPRQHMIPSHDRVVIKWAGGSYELGEAGKPTVFASRLHFADEKTAAAFAACVLTKSTSTYAAPMRSVGAYGNTFEAIPGQMVSMEHPDGFYVERMSEIHYQQKTQMYAVGIGGIVPLAQENNTGEQ